MRLLMIFILLFAKTVYADIYQSESNGSVVYSDSPINNQQQTISTGTVNSVNSPAINQEKTSNASTVAKPVNEINKPYEIFSILSPKDQETIPNQPVFSVIIEVKPKLQAGDKIQAMLDGKAYGEPVSETTIPFNLIDRGTHQLSAKLINKSNQVIKETNTIVVYVRRATINAP